MKSRDECVDEWDVILNGMARQFRNKVLPRWPLFSLHMIWVVPVSYKHESDDPYEHFDVVVRAARVRDRVAISWPRGAESGLWRVDPSQNVTRPGAKVDPGRIRNEIQQSFDAAVKRFSTPA